MLDDVQIRFLLQNYLVEHRWESSGANWTLRQLTPAMHVERGTEGLRRGASHHASLIARYTRRTGDAEARRATRAGGERAAIIDSLLGTAKLNGIDPEA
jgi:hypothetical protein